MFIAPERSPFLASALASCQQFTFISDFGSKLVIKHPSFVQYLLKAKGKLDGGFVELLAQITLGFKVH